MAAKGNPICGGVTLLHTEHERKHSYEVKGFLNCNTGMFTSKGDKLLTINGKNVDDLTPEAIADVLVEGSVLLTIHHPSKKPSEECGTIELSVTKKVPVVMNFSLAMVTESELETGVYEDPEHPGLDNREIEDDCFSDENLLIVSMDDTNFSLVVSRGCDPDNPCDNCGEMNCQFNDVVVLPARAEITSSSSKILSKHKEKNNLFLKSFLKQRYITPSNRQMCLNDTMSAPITIYYYQVNIMDISGAQNLGVPVVLNFTGTQNFFCCITKQDTKILTAVPFKKSDLRKICADDPEKWSLVFYMSSGADNLRRFESALYRGWFIYTQSMDDVEMCRVEQSVSTQPNTFFVIIESQ